MAILIKYYEVNKSMEMLEAKYKNNSLYQEFYNNMKNSSFLLLVILP